MTFAQRLQADRRAAALAGWRATERRMAQRRTNDSARVAHWIDRFSTARQSAMATGN